MAESLGKSAMRAGTRAAVNQKAFRNCEETERIGPVSHSSFPVFPALDILMSNLAVFCRSNVIDFSRI